jgi:hypothetical protein
MNPASSEAGGCVNIRLMKTIVFISVLRFEEGAG